MGLKSTLVKEFKNGGIVALKNAQKQFEGLSTYNADKIERIVQDIINKEARKITPEQQAIVNKVKKSQTTRNEYVIDCDIAEECKKANLSLSKLILHLADGWLKGEKQKPIVIRTGKEATVIGDDPYCIQVVKQAFKDLEIADNSRLSVHQNSEFSSFCAITVSLTTHGLGDIMNSIPKPAALDLVSWIVDLAHRESRLSAEHKGETPFCDMVKEAASKDKYCVQVRTPDVKYVDRAYECHPKNEELYAVVPYEMFAKDVAEQAKYTLISDNNRCKEVILNGEPVLATGYTYRYDIVFTSPFTGDKIFASHNDMILIDKNGEFIAGVSADELSKLPTTSKSPEQCALEIAQKTEIKHIDNLEKYVRASIESGLVQPGEIETKTTFSHRTEDYGPHGDYTHTVIRSDATRGIVGYPNRYGEDTQDFAYVGNGKCVYKNSVTKCIFLNEHIMFNGKGYGPNDALLINKDGTIQCMKAYELQNFAFEETGKPTIDVLKETLGLLNSRKTVKQVMEATQERINERNRIINKSIDTTLSEMDRLAPDTRGARTNPIKTNNDIIY